MNSKERLTRAMRGQEVDYLPCSIYFNSNLQVNGHRLNGTEDYCKLALELETDPFISVSIKSSMHPDVKTESRIEQVKGEEFPILWQIWQTPEGELSQAVRLTGDISDWRQIHWGDHSASNIYKPLIESSKDVGKVRYLYQPTTDEDYCQSLSANKKSFDIANKYGIPTLLTYGEGLALPMFMMGAENLLFFCIDHPDEFNELAQIGHEVSMRKINLAKKMNVDILKRFGGYEMTNFFNPQIFEKVVMPKLKKEVQFAHELGMLIYYRVVTGMEPLLEQIASIGFDCIEGGEPHLSKCSLEDWHDAFAGKTCSWTGISTPVILGSDSTEKVREEVRRVINIFGRKNFILGVTNSIRNHFPWENTLAMIDEWKKIRR
ncbi:MAG: hypothetical protein UT30_C0024G0011 [Candidatus Uhrbacteria bacterium GW2011_GWF2_39_13]|uniref:Uroporphyrinogen decarboxylase (URO-D) domain-containing protein n=1 Tax=Candidatus Uhrbacteria bacterium GW2011_GWF2_39_13 TaxID=1618995 RepID=A0A0G0MT82_9BACT|nr:MAG: hypothetical protein UT30_C0024G0011 [Candidatus Uhrbacteria bacterium GW2011_GWF2_39_13]